jgi:hypothetical protein
MSKKLVLHLILSSVLFCTLQCAHAQTVTWAGRSWNLTSGHMAGVAPGDPANLTIDAHGYLHLRIVQQNGKWTAAELFTTENLGFGTYQWIVEGNVYAMDPTTVLGLFTYGPTHHIGTNAEDEIDIEFSQWNKTCHGCNADFTVYPATGHRKPKGVSAWEDNFHVTGGTLTTARMDWFPDHIVFTLMNGAQPIRTVADVIKAETYTSDATNIPQVPAPVGINLWSFKQTPAQDQSVVIRDFEFAAH